MITDEELGKGLLTLHIIWFAMLASLAIYLFIGLRVATNLPTSMNEDRFAILRAVLYLLAFITLSVTRFFRKLILTGKGQLGQPKHHQHPLLQRYTIAMIVAWALSESVGIYGLVLFFLGKNTTDLYLLIIVSAIAMFLYRPRKDEITGLDQKSWVSSNSGAGRL